MAGKIEARLKELGVTLPAMANPVANYVPFSVAGSLVFVAGQICQKDGKVTYAGKVGTEIDIETGKAAARLCALNILAVLKSACGGDLDRVVRCLRLGGFVNAAPDFLDVPQVVNGASDLIVEIFGDAGRHARTAVGAILPRAAAVEVDGIFEIRQ